MSELSTEERARLWVDEAWQNGLRGKDIATQAFIAAVKSNDTERDQLRDKALRFDLDQAGIERREAEAVELVELRAENEQRKRYIDDLHDTLSRIAELVPKNQISSTNSTDADALIAAVARLREDAERSQENALVWRKRVSEQRHLLKRLNKAHNVLWKVIRIISGENFAVIDAARKEASK